MKRSLLFLFLLVVCLHLKAQLRGVVLDDTGEPIPHATVQYKDQKVITVADEEGVFSIARHEGWTLTVSFVGMKTQQIPVTAKTPTWLKITMKEEGGVLSEVQIKAKRVKYSRKNNPAIELMKRVIQAKKKTHLENHDYVQYSKYQKISFARNDYKIKEDTTGQKKSKWAEHTEVSPYNNKVILPISVDETVTKHIYRKDPRKEKDIIEGEQSTGLNQLFATGDILNTILKELFQDVDIYDDYVRLVQFPFVSPIGSTAISFYRYYIVDTVMVANDRCYHVNFLPNNPQDFGFRGDLYILADSSLHVRKVSLTIPQKSDVNYVDEMHIEQEYTKLENGDWVLTEDDMWAELKVLSLPMLVVRNTRLSDYAFDELPDKLFKGKAKTVHTADARTKDEEYWNTYRKVELTENESGFDSFMKVLQGSTGGKVVLFVLKPLIENFIETTTGEKKSKFDIGPVASFISTNYVDGFRTTLGGRTMGELNPHFFWKGYVAHGFKSDKNYYSSEFTYAINKKQNSPFEFPQRNITFESENDVMSASDKFLINNKDNIFMGLRTQKVTEMYFYNKQRLSFIYETLYGFSINAALKAESNRVAGTLQYKRMGTDEEVRKIRTTELTAGIKYCPGQTFINTKQRRWPLNLDSPEFTLTHTTGFKNFLGGQYNSQLTEIGVYKRQWLGSWGFFDTHINAAAQWNKVPYPMLILPPTDVSYLQQEETFSMLRNMEFFMDRKLYLSLAWNMNGKILNRIPLIKRLKWREILAFKAIWGDLTDKNNPLLQENQNDSELFYFPASGHVLTPKNPYMEFAAGITNVFKVFSVQWVRRLNYLDNPKVHRDGIRFALVMTF
jgi:hypothetical protein